MVLLKSNEPGELQVAQAKESSRSLKWRISFAQLTTQKGRWLGELGSVGPDLPAWLKLSGQPHLDYCCTCTQS